MMTDAERAEKNRANVRRWYKQNKDEYNAKRRERYQADQEQREKARERAARYRAENPSIERQLQREYNGNRVPVFSTGQVAQKLGRTPQMIRNWEKEGMIPESVFPDQHRLYTQKQVDLILALAEVIAASGGSWSAPEVKKAVANMHKRW